MIGTNKIVEDESSPTKVNPPTQPDQASTQPFDKYEKESQCFILQVMDYHKMDKTAAKRELNNAMNHIIAQVLQICEVGSQVNFEEVFRWFKNIFGDHYILLEDEKSYRKTDSRNREWMLCYLLKIELSK